MDALLPTRPRLRIPALNVALFLATVATTLWAGFWYSPLAAEAPTLGRVIDGGLPFAAALVAILFTHEMGHYVLARRHGVDTTLPYFIPVPFGAGTLGAVIRIRSALPTRRAVLEIGAAGPWAGFLVALPLYAWGLAHSEVRPIAIPSPAASGSPFGLLAAWLRGEAIDWPAGNVAVYGDSFVTWAAQRLVVGELAPGTDVMIHPVAMAAWIGLFITSLNMVPVGQLDGGHVLYALLGRARAELAGRVVSLGLLAAGLFLSWNWLVWWALTRFVIRTNHPPALVEERLSPAQRAFAAVSLLLFAGTFIPVPIRLLPIQL